MRSDSGFSGRPRKPRTTDTPLVRGCLQMVGDTGSNRVVARGRRASKRHSPDVRRDPSERAPAVKQLVKQAIPASRRPSGRGQARCTPPFRGSTRGDGDWRTRLMPVSVVLARVPLTMCVPSMTRSSGAGTTVADTRSTVRRVVSGRHDPLIEGPIRSGSLSLDVTAVVGRSPAQVDADACAEAAAIR